MRRSASRCPRAYSSNSTWVPEHFYAKVLAVLRRQFLTQSKLAESQATAAVNLRLSVDG